MTFQQFIDEYNGKYLTLPGDVANQCVNLAQEWAILNNKPKTGGDAITWANLPGYDWVPITANQKPNPGDLMVFAIKPHGHISIYVHETTGGFVSFDQNWPLGAPCNLITHNYSQVIGWLKVLQEEQVTDLEVNHIKVDSIEQIFLNRELNDGDAPAITGRAQIVTDKIHGGESTHQSLNEIVEDVIKGAQGDDRQRLRDQFNHWLTLIP